MRGPTPASMQEALNPRLSLQRAVDIDTRPHTLPMGSPNGAFPLDAYLAKSDIDAKPNEWNTQVKFCALASLHRGPAMKLFTTLPPSTATAGEYQVFLDDLEARFCDRHLQTLHHSELRHHQQHLGEFMQAFAADVERFAQKAFRGSTPGILDAVGTAAFLDAIGDFNVQR